MEEPRSLDHLLAQINHLHRSHGHRAFSELGLHRGQPPVLHLLWDEDGRTHSELARQLHVAPPTITKMIQRMEKSGFVERQSDPKDQRVSRVYLTPAGRELYKRMKETLERFDRGIRSNFTEEEQTELFRLLLKVRAYLLDSTEDKSLHDRPS